MQTAHADAAAKHTSAIPPSSLCHSVFAGKGRWSLRGKSLHRLLPNPIPSRRPFESHPWWVQIEPGCDHRVPSRRGSPTSNPSRQGIARAGWHRSAQELFRFVALNRRQFTGDRTRYRRLYPPIPTSRRQCICAGSQRHPHEISHFMSPQRDRSRIRLKRRGKIKAAQGRILAIPGFAAWPSRSLQASRRGGIVSNLETTASTHQAVPDAVKLISFLLLGLGPEVSVDLHSDEERTKIVEIDHNLSHADIGQVA